MLITDYLNKLFNFGSEILNLSDLKNIRILEIITMFFLCLIPLFWFRNGQFYANGDDFPLFLNSHQTFLTGASLWSPNYLGYATPMPAYLLYQNIGAFLSTLGLSVGAIQTIFLISLFVIAAFSMFYLTNKIYPKSKIAPFIASFFYVFNFFFLINLRNIGFRWTYAFLPLMLGLFFNIMNATNQNDKKSANTNVIYFALVSIVAFSFASINPANIALFLIGLAVMAFYFLFKLRKKAKLYLFSIVKTFVATFMVSMWWIVPVFNSFIFSGEALNSQVSISAWNWTQVRSSFLNLFWLNGSWNWSEEYYPYVSVYSNIFLTIIVFIPLILAASALLYKGNKAHFNAFLMAAVLFFLFLAKGLHEPFSQFNAFLYQYVPLMNMFREPVSKFTIVMLPFMALLVGYGSERLVNIKLPRVNYSISKVFISVFLMIILLVSVSPILLDSMETKSPELPFSSQVKIPDYWYQATDWINLQPGDCKVLLTPLDDFYQMPYTWGYYGTDQLLERLFEKPMVSTAALDGYISNANSTEVLRQFRVSIKFNNTAEFKALMDLFSVKYIVQRNDVNATMIEQIDQRNGVNITMHGRDLMKPSEMKTFLAQQPYLKFVRSFGELDIYQYSDAKPPMYTLLQSNLQKTSIHIDSRSTSIGINWDFTYQDAVNDWLCSTPSNQSQATCRITQQNGYLTANMWNLTSSWIRADSPLLHSNNESKYQISAVISALNDRNVTLAVAEYSENKTLLTTSSLGEIKYGNGTYSNWLLSNEFEPKNEQTAYLQIQLWNYFNASETNQSSLYLSDVSIFGSVSTLNVVGFECLYGKSNNDPAILSIQDVSPTKIIVSVNASQPFILGTSQELDKFWVAYVNGEKVQPVSLYLGLKGYMINETGQFTVNLEYEPQAWFNYSLVLSGVTVLLLIASLFYLNRDKLKLVLNDGTKKRQK
jgi:hypothetical protein